MNKKINNEHTEKKREKRKEKNVFNIRSFFFFVFLDECFGGHSFTATAFSALRDSSSSSQTTCSLRGVSVGTPLFSSMQ